MSTYSLSGSGVQALTADTTALHVTITALSPFGGIGHANPTNHYHQALLRPGDGTGYWSPIPVEGGPQWIGLPNGTDRIGYSCEGGAVISVAEVIGGASPFAGPPGSTGPAGPAGSSGTTLINSNILPSAASTVTFASIPGTYAHLELVLQARGSNASADINPLMRFNSDSAANYDTSFLFQGSAGGTGTNAAQTSINTGNVAAANAPANSAGSYMVWIPNYAGTTFHKVAFAHGYERRGAPDNYIFQDAGVWKNTAAITQIDILASAGDFVAGSGFWLYGR